MTFLIPVEVFTIRFTQPEYISQNISADTYQSGISEKKMKVSGVRSRDALKRASVMDSLP
jgi:hypothetical protein